MKKSVKFLCMIMFVTLFTFSISCQNVKAYQYNDDMTATFTITTTREGGGTDVVEGILSQDFGNNNNRGVYMYFDGDTVNDLYAPDSSRLSVNGGYVYFSRLGCNASYTGRTLQTDIYISANVTGFQSNVFRYVKNKIGIELENYCMFGAVYMNEGKRLMGEVTLETPVEYVDNLDDLKAFFEGDNSVVKNGDPANQVNDVTNNHNLPVPQEVEVYKDSENPAVVWANPVISGNKTVYVEIDWLPTIDCINGRSVISTLKPSDYVRCCYEKLDGHNAFITQQFETSRVSNDLMGYDYITDSKPLYSLNRNSWFNDLNTNSALQFVETPLMYIIGEDKFNSFNIRGLKYRIRYVFGTENGGNWTAEEVSDWIYSDRRYGYDNKSPSPHSTTNRYTASGDPVDNTNYRPNTDPNIINVSSDGGDSWWVKFNNDTLSVFNIFTNNINKEEASMIDDDNDSSIGRSDSIFKLVAGFFKEFPIFMVFLISGFAVVVFLRIFGR